MNEINISISEINSYLKCRRAWSYSSNIGESLRHKVTPKVFFVVGSAVHEAIEANVHGADPFVALDEYIDKERESRVEDYVRRTGQKIWPNELNEFEESAELARKLAKQYFRKYGLDNPLADQGLKYVAVELPFSIPMFTTPQGVQVNLVGTWDAIATDIETESLFYIIENKTAARKPDPDTMQYGNQFVGYPWVFRTITGHAPAGLLYNGVIKNIIENPRVLKNGELSQNKTARVTLESFMETVTRGNYDPEKYLDYIEYLAEREAAGDDRFFFRQMFTHSNTQLDGWYHTVSAILSEMVEGPMIYPNFTSCQGCLFKDLCYAEENGEDVQQLKELRYETGTYGTMAAVNGATPADLLDCGSAEELVSKLRTLTSGE